MSSEVTKPEEAIGRVADSLGHDDVRAVEEHAEHIRRAVRREGPLGRFVDDIELMLEMVTDAVAGRYQAVSRRAVAASSFALLYVFSPLDVLPDAIPFLGQLDDASVMGATIAFAAAELAAYRRWREEHKRPR